MQRWAAGAVAAATCAAAALTHVMCPAKAMVVPSVASMARRAVELSNKANVDPSYADEACRLWANILDPDCNDSEPPLPLAAMPAAHGLHASTLVRVGRDKEAIGEYQKSLGYLKDAGALSKPLTKEEVDIRIGMGKSLQRMLRYRDAADAFLDACERCDAFDETAPKSRETPGWVYQAQSQTIQGAVFCNMRVGGLEEAISIVESCGGKDTDVWGMLGALLLIQALTASSTLEHAEKLDMMKKARETLRSACEDARTASPLYGWLHLTTLAEKSDPSSDLLGCTYGGDAYLSFAKVNNSPFDDPGLINLDDKIRLHSFIVNQCRDDESFWPRGYILPQDMALFLAECETDAKLKKMWMLKERSGYGSHGNSVASAEEVISMHRENRLDESILCQRIVEPPMLIDGRKFSLRVYAVYFPRGMVLSEDGEREFNAEVYISTEGLAKCASSAYLEDSADVDANSLGDQYMTNSGRGDGRTSQQSDLRQLQKEFEANGYDYLGMWKSIERSIQTVMKQYTGLQKENATDDTFIHNTHAPLCSVPKILGFDYILDLAAQPFLLEINRFPGLEPRSSMDEEVKWSVVYDAWLAACERLEVSTTCIKHLRPSGYKGCALKRLVAE